MDMIIPQGQQFHFCKGSCARGKTSNRPPLPSNTDCVMVLSSMDFYYASSALKCVIRQGSKLPNQKFGWRILWFLSSCMHSIMEDETAVSPTEADRPAEFL
jgi:hypothetical protein